MSIDHPWNDGFACDVDHARTRASHHRGFVSAAYEDNPITADRHRFGARARRVGGVDAGVGYDDVGLLCKSCGRDGQQNAGEQWSGFQLVLLAARGPVPGAPNWRIYSALTNTG